MKDYIGIQLARKLFSEEEYEKACPVCEYCGLAMTYSDYFYDVGGEYICTNRECVDSFMKQFRRSITSYLENGR